MTNQTDYLKEEFFNTLFEQQVKRYTNSIDKKNLEISVICSNPALTKYFSKLFKKYKINHTYADYMNECIFWTYRAIQRFEVKDEGSWEAMIAGTDKPNIGRVINNIKTTVGFEIYKFANGDAKFTMGKVNNGENGHITLKMEMNSLDSLLEEGSESGNLLDILSEENSMWSSKEEQYSLSYFAEWFEANKKSILTASQLKLLADLKKCRKIEGYTTDDVYEVTGVESFRINTKLKKMATRVEKAWSKENPLNFKNRLEMQRDKELLIWKEVIALVEDEEDLHSQNLRLTNYFMNNYETEKVANLVVDNLMGEDIILFNRIYKNRGTIQIALPAKVLYKLINAVEGRIATLNKMDCHVGTAPLKTKKTPPVASKVQPCVVYDFNGMFLRMEDGKPEKQSKTTILYVLPNGVQVPLGNQEYFFV